MKLFLTTFVAGLLFGMGLAVSEMVDPGRVTGFLDIAGQWDPTLLLVMGGALTITLPGFYMVLKLPGPWFSERFSLPTKKDLDWRLIAGATLFGIGWGMAGFCPGPALAALVTLSPQVVLFMLAMIAGQLLAMLVEKYTRPL